MQNWKTTKLRKNTLCATYSKHKRLFFDNLRVEDSNYVVLNARRTIYFA
jgi:hypothetical protein